MARGESESRAQLPKVPAEHVDDAVLAIGDKVLDRDSFANEVYTGPMSDTDPGLRAGLALHEEFRSILLPHDKEGRNKVRFGSAYMFSVMDELRSEGYAIPVVDEDVAHKDIEQTINQFGTAIQRSKERDTEGI